jgi:hypothetical protein
VVILFAEENSTSHKPVVISNSEGYIHPPPKGSVLDKLLKATCFQLSMEKKIEEVLIQIGKKLDSHKIKYVFVGSSSLALQGIPIQPHDIDIATNKKGLDLIQKEFKEFVKISIERRLSKINLKFGIKSYANFLTLEIQGIKVEAMSGLKIKNQKLNYLKKDIAYITKDKIKLPCLIIKKIYDAYVLAENTEKIKLIEPYLK